MCSLKSHFLGLSMPRRACPDRCRGEDEIQGPLPSQANIIRLKVRYLELILEKQYSPYAVLMKLDEKGLWPEGLRICEKTLYNWIEAGISLG